MLIDAGWAVADAREVLEAGLRTLGFGLGDIRSFAITHVHRDHYTQAIALRREFGMHVALGEGERPTLESIREPSPPPLAKRLQHLRLLGARSLAQRMEPLVARMYDPATAGFEMPDEWMVGSQILRHGGVVLEAVSTPGHTRGHLVFHDREGEMLFAGDHVLPTITPSLGYEAQPAPNPLGDFLASLALVRSRPDARLLPGHGPVAPSVHARVDELVAHHGARLEAAAEGVERGATTAYEVAAFLTWTKGHRRFEDLDDFNQALAVTETAAHLDLLSAQGRLRRSEVEGCRIYLAP
jgi:glyoxylase-like metal-dependent hydrolase (beta-lactamase superfamily II)